MPYYKVPTTNKVIQMLDRRGRLERVIDLVSSLPSTPAEGDRYIDLSDNKVKEWDGSAWQEYIPKEGDNLYVLNRDKYYFFDGINWKDVTEISSYWEEDGDTLKPINVSNVEITGSFIGDGSQLTGIKKLIEEFVAQGNVTAGDVVAFVNGKIRKGNFEIINEIEKVSDEYQFSLSTEHFIVGERLDDYRFVLVYTGGSSTSYKGRLIIGKVSDNNILFGPEYDLDFDIYGASISVLRPDKFVLVYANGTINGKVLLCNVNGDDTISFGNEMVFYEDRIMGVSSVALDEFNIVVSFSHSIDYIGKCVKISIVNDNFVVGNVIQFCEKATSIRSSKKDENSFILCYKDYNSSDGIFRVCSVSDMDILLGEENIFASGIYSISNVHYLDNNKMVIIYWYYKDYRVRLLDLNNIQLDEKQIYNDSVSYFTSHCLGNKFMVTFKSVSSVPTDPKKFYVVIGSINDVIELGNLFEVYEGFGDYNEVILLSNYMGIFSFAKSTNEGISKICFFAKKRVYNYAGISQETKSDGETTKVLIQGISDVHSGLEVGKKYYATLEGDLTTEPTEDYLGIAIAEDKLLLMDWQRPTTLYDEDTDEFLMSDTV